MEKWKQRLRQAREAKGLSKTEFAKAAGVSGPTVTDWEKPTQDGGIKEISGQRLTKIAEILGVDAAWIMDGKANSAQGDETKIPPKPVRIPMLHRLSDDEEEVLARYRLMSDEDKKLTQVFIRGRKLMNPNNVVALNKA